MGKPSPATVQCVVSEAWVEGVTCFVRVQADKGGVFQDGDWFAVGTVGTGAPPRNWPIEAGDIVTISVPQIMGVRRPRGRTSRGQLGTVAARVPT